MISNVVRYSDVLISGLTTCRGVLTLIGGITVKKKDITMLNKYILPVMGSILYFIYKVQF